MSVRILVGDVREQLDTLKDQSVQCCVTSPPYYGLRDYGVAGQIGLEPTLAEYIATMVDVFRGVRRVLADDGVLFLNIGDSYASSGVGGAMSDKSSLQNGKGINPKHKTVSFGRAPTPAGMKPKDLMMVPARLAIALQDDGWYLRSDIIWAKPNPMPESVRDRPTSAHEHIFLLTKRAKYFYDSDAVAEPSTGVIEPTELSGVYSSGAGRNDAATHFVGGFVTGETRNLRNVWPITTKPFPGAHFATFPPEIPRRCIKAGTSEKGQCPACGKPWVRNLDKQTAEPARSGSWKSTGESHRNDIDRKGGFYDAKSVTTGWAAGCDCNAGDPVPQTVLDPFLGSGTTLLVADELGRNGIGIELNPEYAAMAERRITGACPMFADVGVE